MSQRLVRLVGAGVPLTDAFQAVVEEIIDNGPADFDTLNSRVQSVMYLKEKRILSSGWRTWQDFTRDILDQISGVDEEAVPTLMNVQGKWSALEFTRGVAYTAIPKANVTYTVWDEETRLARDLKARMQMDFNRLKSEIQVVIDRYPDMPESYLSQVQRAVSSFSRMAREMSGVNTVGDVDDDELMPKRIVAPRPEVVRGQERWRQLTGCKMMSPVKELTGELVNSMPPGKTFNLVGMTVLVGRRLDDIEKDLPEPLGRVKSSTVRQALQGKSKEGTGGLIGDGVIERLDPTTFRKL